MGLVAYIRTKKELKQAKRAARTRAERIFFGSVSLLAYVVIVAMLIVVTPRALSVALNTQYPIAAITSSSMWPSLHVGDLVIIQGVDPATLSVGDIIVYTNELHAFTIHRVVEKDQEAQTIVTKGDANEGNDKPISYDNVVGRLYTMGGWRGRIPKLGYISMMVTNQSS